MEPLRADAGRWQPRTCGPCLPPQQKRKALSQSWKEAMVKVLSAFRFPIAMWPGIFLRSVWRYPLLPPIPGLPPNHLSDYMKQALPTSPPPLPSGSDFCLHPESFPGLGDSLSCQHDISSWTDSPECTTLSLSDPAVSLPVHPLKSPPSRFSSYPPYLSVAPAKGLPGKDTTPGVDL